MGGRLCTREMRAAERRHHKGRGANPGIGVNPGAAWPGANVPEKSEPRSGVIIKAEAQTPVWVSTPAGTRAAERRYHKRPGCQPRRRVDGGLCTREMRAAERRYHKGRGVNPGTGVGGRRSTREMRAAERRYHKGQGVNPSVDVDVRGFEISPTPSRGAAKSRWGV